MEYRRAVKAPPKLKVATLAAEGKKKGRGSRTGEH